ncbi:MAG TPA: hypothetical protein VFD74_09075 [Thermoleophilia bacterium]|nr:hypothetical protein [Thermoleophilia bacterium]
MTLYVDTSALIKAYVTEEASEDVLALIGEAEVVATSRLAYPVFACYDRRLNQAARVEGLQVFGPI